MFQSIAEILAKYHPVTEELKAALIAYNNHLQKFITDEHAYVKLYSMENGDIDAFISLYGSATAAVDKCNALNREIVDSLEDGVRDNPPYADYLAGRLDNWKVVYDYVSEIHGTITNNHKICMQNISQDGMDENYSMLIRFKDECQEVFGRWYDHLEIFIAGVSILQDPSQLTVEDYEV